MSKKKYIQSAKNILNAYNSKDCPVIVQSNNVIRPRPVSNNKKRK